MCTFCTIKISTLLSLILSTKIHTTGAYRIKGSANEKKHFIPYERGSVGNVQQFTTSQTSSNQGYTESIVLGDSVGKNRVKNCPKMIGPINDEYFCRGKEYGYCDRRSGTCFCTPGYIGDACEACAPTHFNIGDVCYAKTLCPNDCSGFGQCNYQTGVCECNEYREGEDCSIAKCSRYHEFCTTCDENGCIQCEGGFSSHKTARWGDQCQPCWRFDPRCRTCSEEACTSCIDLLLLSIHRSGRRPHDPPLPVDELMRELSVTVPFGSAQEDAFYDAEHYFLVDSSITPLHESAVECHQGLNNDDSISCNQYNLTSHIMCGNHGTITFDSPEYAVREDERHVRLTLRRSGGGVGEVTVLYSLYPITAGFEDLSSTAHYTTNRTVVFQSGQITASFLVIINDDRILEPNETFSVHLSNPTGGASLGTQQRTIVTIIDDDADRTCSHNVETNLGANGQQPDIGLAGYSLQFNLFAKSCAGDVSMEGADMFKVVARKLTSEESYVGADTVNAIGGCAHSIENAYVCAVNATTSGNYKVDIYHIIPGGLRGYYFSDNFLDNTRLGMVRTDASVNFTWGTGPVTTFGRDFVSVRWEGYLRPTHSETYTFWLDIDDHARLWIDGNLLIDWWSFSPALSMLHAKHTLTAFELYDIILEYRDILGNATARLLWSSESTPITTIPSSSLFYKEPIRDSPFEYVVLPAATDASQSEAVGEDLHTAVAGTQHTFTISPKDAFGNFRGWPLHAISNDERHLDAFYVTVQLLDIAEGVIDTSFNVDVSYDVASRIFFVSYTPRTSGQYQLNVTYEANGNSMHIIGSPFALEVVPGETSAQESIAFGPGLHFGMAGEAVTAVIQAFDSNRNMRDVGGDDWEVSLTSRENSLYQYGHVEDYRNGTYSLHVVPLVAGPNDLSIRFNGIDIRGSPFYMNVVHNEADASSSFIINEAEVLTAMEENSIFVQTVDKWANKVINCDEEPYNTSISVHSEEIDEDATQIEFVGDGKVKVTLIPVKSGKIYLGVMLNGVDIVNSPLRLSVRPGAFFVETSLATGMGLSRAQAGRQSYFSIKAKDKGGNSKVLDEAMFNVTLTLLHRASIPVGLEILSDINNTNTNHDVVVKATQSFNSEEGIYVIEYTCFVAGIYALHVNDYQGNNIVGSPFSVQVSPAQLSGKHSIISGDGRFKGVAGKISLVRFYPRDEFDNFILDCQETIEMELQLLSRHEKNENLGDYTINQLVRVSGDGTFNLDFVSTYAGVYALDVATFLPGGLEASYYSSPDFSPDHLVFSSIEDNVDKDWGGLFPFPCETGNFCGSIGATGPYHIAAKWSGKVKADFNEEHEIRASCNDGGYISISIAGAYVPWQSCWPHTTTRIVLTTKPVDFALRYKNYEGEDLFVTLEWSSPSTGTFATIPSSNLLHHHAIGKTLNPQIYPDVAYAPLSIAKGESLRHAVSGIEQEFLVESRDGFGNLLLRGDARVVSSAYNKNATIQTSVFDNANGTFSVRYTPSLSGVYYLSVQIGELSTSPLSHIQGSPYLLTVQPGASDPRESILLMDNHGLGITGRSIFSWLQTRDKQRNKRHQGGDEVIAYLSAVQTPSEKYHCRADDDNSGVYIIECPSQWREGHYILNVSIVSSYGVAVPLASGPFNVTLFPGHAIAATTSVVSGSGGTPIITEDSGMPSISFIAHAGIWSSFLVSTKDRFGNHLQQGGNHFASQIVGNDAAEVQVIDQGNGDYIVAYKVTEAAKYELVVGMATGSGLVGQYYLKDTNFVDGNPIKTKVDERIDFNTWRLDDSESFSYVTWTGYISFPHSGKFELEMTGVEGHCKLFIGNKLVVDSSGGSIGSYLALENVLYELAVEYSMNINRLLLKLYWSSSKISRQIVQVSHFFSSTEPIHGSPFHLSVL